METTTIEHETEKQDIALKQQYETPRVTVLGKVSQLTQAKKGVRIDPSPLHGSRL